MATSTLDTELTCSICLEFYRDPYQLPCMHSFCKQCLVEFSKTDTTSAGDACSKADVSQGKDENTLECPECRQVIQLDHKGIDGLPRNFTLANIVQKYAKQEEKEEKKYPCDVCDMEPPSNAVKFCLQCGFLYCNACLTQLHPKRGKLKTHKLEEPSENHFSQSLSSEDSKLVESLLLSSSNLDVIKRKVERKIREIEKNIDSLQENGSKRKKETRVCFDRLCTLLKTKEQQFMSEVDNEVDEKTDDLMLQLSSCRQFAEDINKVIKDIKIAVEDFPKKKTRTDLQTIQKRSLDLERKTVVSHQQNLTARCGMVNTDDIEEKLEALGNDTGETKKKGHLWNINIKLLPTKSGASISVTWVKMPGKDIYDVTVECILQNGIRERTQYSCVPGSRHKIDNLRPDTTYHVSVADHGESNTASQMVKFQTLKCVPCKPFTLNGRCASEDTFISEDSNILIPENRGLPETCSTKKYTRIMGTTGTIGLSGCQYWETKILFSFPNGMRKGDYVFDIGICYKTTIDRVAEIFKNFNAYSVNVVKRGNKDIVLEFSREGKEDVGKSKDLIWESEMRLHLGYYVNMDGRTFSVIDVTKNCILFTFDNIKTTAAYVPVFCHSNHKNKPRLEIRLLTGGDIHEIPSCMLELLNGQNPLKDAGGWYGHKYN